MPFSIDPSIPWTQIIKYCIFIPQLTIIEVGPLFIANSNNNPIILTLLNADTHFHFFALHLSPFYLNCFAFSLLLYYRTYFCHLFLYSVYFCCLVDRILLFYRLNCRASHSWLRCLWNNNWRLRYFYIFLCVLGWWILYYWWLLFN